jgi:type VI secretion system protein ImpI
MFIRLQIKNAEVAGPDVALVYRSRNRGFEIGREDRDWVLPDPDKIISGRHCEIRFEDQAFWLHDVSRNGTFLNGSTERLAAPHRLNKGDRLRIGRYLIGVSVEDDGPMGPDSAETPLKPVTPASEAAPREALGLFQSTGLQQKEQALPAQVRDAGSSGDVEAFLRQIAGAAGIAPDLFARRDHQELAEEIGAVLRTTVEELSLLLKARAAAKVLAKNAHRTLINATDNNPLKFVPGTEEMLDIMFAKRRTGYLDARHSLEDGFRDLKTHEFATYAAMQAALSRLLDDLSPEAIERKLPPSSFASKKSRAWDALVATWETRERAHENGMLDVFLAYFSEAYAKASKPK